MPQVTPSPDLPADPSWTRTRPKPEPDELATVQPLRVS